MPTGQFRATLEGSFWYWGFGPHAPPTVIIHLKVDFLSFGNTDFFEENVLRYCMRPFDKVKRGKPDALAGSNEGVGGIPMRVLYIEGCEKTAVCVYRQ